MIDPRLNFPSISNIYPEKKWSPLERRFVRHRHIVQFLPASSRDQDLRGGMKEKQAVKCGGEGANTSAEHRNPSFNARDASFFLFFSKYLLSISRIVETRLDFRVFLESLRYGGKKKKRENKREEKERGGEMEGSEGGRRRKQRGEERVAHNGANEKEEGERVRKRKKNRRGRDVSSRAFHFPCLSFLPSPPARQRSFRRGTRSQVFSGPIRDEVSNGKFERINHFPRG